MKKIVTVYFGDDWNKEIPITSEHTRISFEDWHRSGIENGIEMYRASILWYDKKTKSFSKAWAFRNGSWIKVEESIRPDMIFDKIAGKHDFELFDLKVEISKTTKVFNHPLFRTLLDNKLEQYLLFNEYMPTSFMAENQKQLISLNEKIKSEKVVIKPLYGSGGVGIFIGEKEEAEKQKFEYPVLMQEFIKSENGVPGFSQQNEVSDLRLVYMNHKLIFALSRIAKDGSLFTNFHQGASAVLVPEDKIPASAHKIAENIIKKLSVFSQAQYSLDFIFTNEGKPILVEINTTPGFDLLYIVGDEDIKQKNFKEFAKLVD